MSYSEMFPFGQLFSHVNDSLIGAASEEQKNESVLAVDGIIEVSVWAMRDNGEVRYSLAEPQDTEHKPHSANSGNPCDCSACNDTQVTRENVFAYVGLD